jgi:phage shock protein PspC (stress-responsive transcriptional regulator)
MSTTPPEAPPEPPGAADDGTGPRVTRDEVRDLGRLRRSARDRKLAGVAGGLARHLDIDPLIPRVLLVVLVFFGGSGILLYAVLWLVVPVEGTDEATVRLDERSRTAAIVVVGVLSVLALVGDSVGGWGFPWPLVVLGAVVLAVLAARGPSRTHPWLRQTPPVPSGGWVGALDVPTAPTAPTAPAPTRPYVAAPDHPVHEQYQQQGAHQPYRPSPRRRGPVLFWYALALIALGVGVLGIVDTAGADVPGSAYPAVGLGTCAVLLVVGAFWGRAGGLIALGLVSALATAAATVGGEIDAGHVEAAPTSAASVADRYDLAFGEIELDLTRVTDPEALDGRTIEVELDVAGRIEVTVPDDLDVVVHSRIDAGERRVLGERLGDGDDRTTTADGGVGAPEITLDVRAAFGEIEVVREEAVR